MNFANATVERNSQQAALVGSLRAPLSAARQFDAIPYQAEVPTARSICRTFGGMGLLNVTQPQGRSAR